MSVHVQLSQGEVTRDKRHIGHLKIRHVWACHQPYKKNAVATSAHGALCDTRAEQLALMANLRFGHQYVQFKLRSGEVALAHRQVRFLRVDN